MRLVVIGLIFAAVILAGGTAYLLNSYLASQKAQTAAVSPQTRSVKVLVAATDMPVGTVVNANNTKWIDWPQRDVMSGFLVLKANKNPLQGIENPKHVARRAITKGEPILMARLYTTKNPGFLPGVLSPGMRAVAIGTSAKSGAAGFIMPGDRVDVVLTHNMARRAAQYLLGKGRNFTNVVQYTTETVLKNIRVLAVDQKTNEFKNAAKIAKTILLEVSPKQAEVLNTAKAMGKVSLVLRAAQNRPQASRRKDYTTDVEVSPLLQAMAQNVAARMESDRQAAARRAAARKYAPRKPTRKITIYRGNTDTSGTQGTSVSGTATP